MDVEARYKKIGLSLESHVRDAYSEFIERVEDYENQWEGSNLGLWDLFNPVYSVLANSRPPFVERGEWAKDLILAYRNIESIKIELLDYLEELQGLIIDDKDHREVNPINNCPLDDL